MSCLRVVATLALLVLPAIAAAEQERLDSWAVVGLRADGQQALADAVADLRGALSLELSARGSGVVRDEDATRLRLGRTSGSLRRVVERIDAAELYYFQLELGVARSNLESALEELAHASGIPEAWERTRVARMLLGMIHLARRDAGSGRAAEAQFAAVARVQPGWSPAESSYPAEVVARYAEARRKLREGPRGRLRAVCEPACPRGHVYVDSYAMAVPGEAIELPAGSYRVVVTDRFERPDRRSLLREVEVRAGEETRIEVDLSLEGRLVVEEGPVLLVPADEASRRQAAAQVARRLGTGFTLALQAGEAGGLEAWLLDGQGQIVREVSAAGDEEEPALALAAMALGDALPASRPAVASVGEAIVAEPAVEERQLQAPGSSWAAARWGSAGGAVLAASLGLWLHLDAADRDDALRREIGRWEGVLPSENAARSAREEADAIGSQKAWGTGLLVGAGVLSLTAVTLFLLDGEESAQPTIRW